MKEYPKNKNYIVYEDGRIYSIRQKRFLTPKNNWDGYHRLAIWDKGKNVCTGWHRIIAETFIPNPENKPFVNHKNGIKTDNRIENLEWVTQKENIQHAWRTGLAKSQINNAKLSKKIDVFLNDEFLGVYPSTMEIERTLHIPHSYVSLRCKNHKTYKGYSFNYHSETSND